MANAFRALEWRCVEWPPRPGLWGEKARTMTEFTGQDFDPAEAKVIPDAWEHDHCEFCFAEICNDPAQAETTIGYTCDDRRWLCPACYERIISAGEDPAKVVEPHRFS